MIGKKWELVGFYKDMLIYYKEGVLHFGNRHYTNVCSKNVLSAKNRITRYINKLSKKERQSLKYLRYKIQ